MKRKIRKAVRVAKCNHRHSFVLGVASDLWLALTLVVALLAWPVKATARGLHAMVKHHPAMRSERAHTVLCVSLGMALLVVSFTVENLFHHPAWSACVETSRAMGVCPIWETVAAAIAGASRV
jgi:hypothetical protein